MERTPFIVTHSEEGAEWATPPLVMAATALASDMEAEMVLQMSRVRLVKKGFAKVVHENPFPSIVEVMNQFREDAGVPTPPEGEADRACGPYRWNGNSESADRIREVGEAKNLLVY